MATSNLDKLTYTMYKVLPLVYDDALTYEEVVDAIVDKINEMIDAGFNDYTSLINEINAELDQLTTDISTEETTRKNDDNAIVGESALSSDSLDDVTAGSLLGQEIAARKYADGIPDAGGAEQNSLQYQINILGSTSQSAYVGHNYILIGDGLMQGVNGDSPSSKVSGWGQLFRDNLGSNFECYFDSSDDLTGASFTTGTTYLDQLKAEQAAIASAGGDANGITDIVILGGINEGSAEDSINTAMSGLMEYAKENFPKAFVYLGYLGVDGITKTQYYENIENYGGNYLADSKNLLTLSDYVGTDGKHLKSAGYDYYSFYINELIRNKHTMYKLGGLCTINSAAAEFNGGITPAFYEYVMPRGYVTTTVAVDGYGSGDALNSPVSQTGVFVSTGYASGNGFSIGSTATTVLTGRPSGHILWHGASGLCYTPTGSFTVTLSGTTVSCEQAFVSDTSRTDTQTKSLMWAYQTNFTSC